MSARSRLTCGESSQVRAGRFAEPERDASAAARARPRRARTPRARLDAPDAPRVRPEDEDVARHALDGPVLVHGADQRLVGIEHDAVVGDVGDGAAVGERDDARRAPPAQRRRSRDRGAGARPRDRGAAPRPRRGSRRPRRSRRASSSANGARLRARARRARPRSTRAPRTRRRSAARGRRAAPRGGCDAIELARARRARTSAAHSTSSSRDVAKSRPRDVRPSACPERPMRWRNVVTARGEPIWQTRSTEPTSIPSSSDAVADERAHLARLEALLDAQAAVLREAAVVRARRDPRRAARRGDARRARPSAACSRRRASSGARATSAARRS